ncbi:MAG: hypothetical protein H0X37_02140 [Herpetosiphonaceae bacterium]|nr:hypothetical protein [Herpetosiphonaceae bacterium]
MQDATTGLVNLGARWYQPGSGKFVGRDPFAGDVSQPMSLQPYQYGYDSPTLNTDPSGNCIPKKQITVFGHTLTVGERDCVVVTGIRDLNVQDAARRFAIVPITVGQAIQGMLQPTVDLLHDPGATLPVLGRGAASLWNNLPSSAEYLAQASLAPADEILAGFCEGNYDRVMQGLSNVGFQLATAQISNEVAFRSLVRAQVQSVMKDDGVIVAAGPQLGWFKSKTDTVEVHKALIVVGRQRDSQFHHWSSVVCGSHVWYRTSAVSCCQV